MTVLQTPSEYSSLEPTPEATVVDIKSSHGDGTDAFDEDTTDGPRSGVDARLALAHVNYQISAEYGPLLMSKTHFSLPA
jgi:hypothetical protein